MINLTSNIYSSMFIIADFQLISNGNQPKWIRRNGRTSTLELQKEIKKYENVIKIRRMNANERNSNKFWLHKDQPYLSAYGWRKRKIESHSYAPIHCILFQLDQGCVREREREVFATVQLLLWLLRFSSMSWINYPNYKFISMPSG